VYAWQGIGALAGELSPQQKSSSDQAAMSPASPEPRLRMLHNQICMSRTFGAFSRQRIE
jgi:hypothetical protein